MTNEQNPAERRAAPRLALGPEDCVIINNVRFSMRNWSAIGLLFGPMAVPPKVGDKIAIKVSVMVKDQRHRFDASGEVLRVENGMVAVRYACHSPESAAAIRSHFAGK